MRLWKGKRKKQISEPKGKMSFFLTNGKILIKLLNFIAFCYTIIEMLLII